MKCFAVFGENLRLKYLSVDTLFYQQIIAIVTVILHSDLYGKLPPKSGGGVNWQYSLPHYGQHKVGFQKNWFYSHIAYVQQQAPSITRNKREASGSTETSASCFSFIERYILNQQFLKTATKKMLFSRGNLTKDRCASSEPPGLPGPLLSPNLKEEKKIHLQKHSYISGNGFI